MNYQTDTVIIGGGPSGAACGIALQSKGISSIIIEKRAYPREKLCAGLITKKTYRQICRLWHLQHPGKALPHDLFCSETDCALFYYQDERLIKAHASEPFHFVNRSHFDQFLAEMYQNSGGMLLENNSCTEIDLSGHRLTLRSGDTVTFRHLAAADGAVSNTRTVLGIAKPELAFCLETRIPKPAHIREIPVHVYYGDIENGYAWIFPSGDQICIGIISIYEPNTDYLAVFQRFLNAHHISAPKSQWKGAFVPYGEFVNQKQNHPDVVLIGDAGGFVDPIFGEGLYHALSTGIAAAKSVIRCEKRGTVLRDEFLRQTAAFTKTIQEGRRLQKLLFSEKLWKLCRRRVKNKNRFAGFFMDHLVTEYHYTYRQIWKLMLDYKRQK